MRLSLPITIRPLARILLLPRPDMVIMDMMHQIIHIPQLPRIAPFPSTHGNLVIALPAVVILLATAQQRQGGGRVGDLAVGVGGDGGRGGGWGWGEIVLVGG